LEPVSPRLRFDTVATRWLDRFEAKVAASERRPRTLEAHRYQLECFLLPAFAARRINTITVDDVAELLVYLQRQRRSAKTSASTLATLHSVLRYARRQAGRPSIQLPNSSATSVLGRRVGASACSDEGRSGSCLTRARRDIA
jgi:site-specific recombinase XerD